MVFVFIAAVLGAWLMVVLFGVVLAMAAAKGDRILERDAQQRTRPSGSVNRIF